MAKAVVFLLLLICPAANAATTHTVGSSSGWNTGVDYNNWANSQTFNPGDTLVFNYGPSHALDEVNEADYQSCNIGNPVSSNSTSPTTIALTSTDTRYFICPRSNHCLQGMKLPVTVGAAGESPTPGMAPFAPPPPSDGSGATAILAGSKRCMVVGLPLVLAALFGVIG